MPAAAPSTEWTLVIHGGAGTIERKSITPDKDGAVRAALERALEAGAELLAAGDSALDAVEMAVRILEDDPNFNAGRGSALGWNGEAELDAAIMDGARGAAGAVAGVKRAKNPISLARAVMERSEHVFLSGAGADAFAADVGVEQAAPDYFVTSARRRQLEALKDNNLSALDVEYKFGTVGAVARDRHGHVAAATSTGGMTGKRWGRIGDSPVIGAGTYADDRACAVSGTGHGEYFIRAGVAHEIGARMRMLGESAQAAADAVMAEVKALGGEGGVIVVGADGSGVTSFNTPGMYRGMANPSERSVAIYSDER